MLVSPKLNRKKSSVLAKQWMMLPLVTSTCFDSVAVEAYFRLNFVLIWGWNFCKIRKSRCIVSFKARVKGDVLDRSRREGIL